MLMAKKNNYQRTLDSVMRFASAIGENTTINGQFSGGENIVVRGTVKGDSDIKGIIVIMESGCWIGHLVADTIVIAGRVEGNIEARQKLEIVAGGHIVGDVCSPVISMETGAIHEGSLHMQGTIPLQPLAEECLDSILLST